MPVVYIGVIFLLLFLQFSGGERQTRTVGNLTLQATQAATGEEGAWSVREISIRFRGLAFEFGNDAGLIVETASDVVDAPLSSYSTRDDGFDVTFDGGFVVAFTTSSDQVEELQVRLLIPDTDLQIARVSIPFQFGDGASTDTNERRQFVQVDYNGTDYYFTSPPDAVIDPANNRVTIKPSAAGQAIRYVEATAGNPAVVASWFKDPSLVIGDNEYTSLVDDYIDRAYAGWSENRYNSRDLTWDGPAESPAFSEAALAAYLAEATRRGDYSRAYSEMRRAHDLHPDQLSLLSSPFLGDLRAVTDRLVAVDERTSSEITGMIERGEAAVLAQPDIFGFAADRGTPGLYEAIVEFAHTVDTRTIDVPTTIGIVSNAVLSDIPGESGRDVLERFVGLTQQQIISSIVRTDRGFFVRTAPGRIDLFQTIVAGVVLETIGDNTGDDLLRTIGRNLIASVLALSDASGMLPASLLLQGDKIQESDGQIGPEEIYSIIVDNVYYPHQVSLYETAGAGTWAFAAIDFAISGFSPDQWRFRLEYPRLQTHYLLVFGVPVFERIELFGQTWRDAPDFDIYSKGRHYEESSEILMVKYYDDSVQRDIVLYYE